MKDMLAELNQMLEQRERGEEPDFEGFMERFGDFFPENPQTLDELLEIMAQRMAAMQAMLNSMTPEQRAQLQGLAEQLLEDMDLRWQVDQLGENLQQPVPADGLGPQLRLQRPGPARLRRGRAADGASSATSTSSRTCCAAPRTPARSPRSTSTGPASCSATSRPRSLERLAELAKMLEEAGLIENKEGRYELTPRGIRKIGPERARRPVQEARQRQDRQARARAHRRRPRARRTRPSPTSSATRSTSHIERTIRNAIRRTGGGTPVRLSPDDFEVERTEHARPVEHRAHARPVAVDADARQLPRRQEGGDGAALADLDASSRATTSASSASARSPASSSPSSCPRSRGTSSTARTCSTASC